MSSVKLLPRDVEAVTEMASIFSNGEVPKITVRTLGGHPCPGCSECGDGEPDHLYAETRPGYWLCARCWSTPGRPRPEPSPPDHQHEDQIRRRMQERGGTDRHLVRMGRT